MSLPPQASFSSATTAVASRGTAYPSVEEFTSFKLPTKPRIIKTLTSDDISDLSDEGDDGPHKPNPSTPIPPSPVTSDESDHDFNLDDTPPTVCGKSMIYPRHPLSGKRPISIPVSPRWPFQDATPRPSTMVPIARSITVSSSRFNQSRSRDNYTPPIEVSVTESLDEFQINHPNGRLLASHPQGVPNHETGRSLTGRNLANIPTLVEKSEKDAQSSKVIPSQHRQRPFNLFHRRRWSSQVLKVQLLRRRQDKRKRAFETNTIWYERISLDDNIYGGSIVLTLFFVTNAIVSITVIITMTASKMSIPYFIIVWVMASLIVMTFTIIMLFRMRSFRKKAIALIDDEKRIRSTTFPKLSHEGHLHLPADSAEVAHRRQLGAAIANGEAQAGGLTHDESEKSSDGTVVDQIAQPSPVFDPLAPAMPRDTSSVYLSASGTSPQGIEHLHDASRHSIDLMASRNSRASSMTAVVGSAAPTAPMNNHESNC
ncbi:hypothetical protein CORC01_12587 [Colletotrichum orchidophilum]|uniref:Uncharacterized protein n=1 Tax=Colletotrichum orchidophilum TaxID=1209926 RepID=A0A1G4ASW1_9PEZI|nr:uncharacterized protein CORC01_12587 [Colletotrichum orchidophilum]OHE92132.1 hypothetical protein CORC01_12587 [Colletotrichum orchidophilum]